MMHARNFGRFLRQKFAAGPLPTQTGTLSLAKPPAPTPPPAAPKPAMP
ncbi:MAG: twin-arginine translocase subunit TatB, partial [Alphaproteobacteria bacterium]|nr:twin-arginine translocase subunit TatB [Alphaproteobacteria bacterium]